MSPLLSSTVVWHHLHGLRVTGPARRNPLVPVRRGYLVHRDRPLELRVPAGHPRGAESAHQLDLDGMKRSKIDRERFGPNMVARVEEVGASTNDVPPTNPGQLIIGNRFWRNRA